MYERLPVVNTDHRVPWLGVLATLKIMGAWGSKECLSYVDPKSKFSERSDQNCGS